MGKIIVIDGLDGSGKATQTKILTEKLKELGYNVRNASFPAYEHRSSELVKMYLSGEISENPNDINPYAASVFYACDRYIQFQTNLKWFMESAEDDILICDRYTSANILHQGAKIEEVSDRRKYYDWCYSFEKLIGVPKEFMTIMLLVNPEISQELMKDCDKLKVSNDIHENNLQYLKDCYSKASAAAVYNGWYIIDCSPEGAMSSIEEISGEILELVLNKLNKG